MAIYELTHGGIEEVAPTTFKGEKIKERGDLQRVLREQIEVVAPDCMVLAEEFGSWEDSQRRIDILALDKDASLVVIELKRTERGGHMELQAVRYAAMVSAMTFEQAVEAHRKYLEANDQDGDPSDAILSFLEWEDPNEDEFAQEVRIVLVSADFSKELTSAVIWLNDHDIDIRCIRLKPYRHNGTLLLDVQQLIPLPEAAEFQVRLREKEKKEKKDKRREMDYTKFDVTIGDEQYPHLAKRHAIFKVISHLCSSGVEPEILAKQLPWMERRVFSVVPGTVSSDEFIEHRNKELSKADREPLSKGRWFVNDDELIHMNGRTYSARKQWGLRTEEALENLKKEFGNKGWDYRRSEKED